MGEKTFLPKKRRAFVSTRKETPFETAHVRIAVRVSFAPSYLLHARQVHGFRHRELARGGHRPAFRLRCRDGRVTRGQRACGDKTYAENIDRHRRRFARRKTTSRQSRRNVKHGVSVDALITRKRTLSRPTYPPPPPLPLPPVNRSLSRSPRPPRPCARIATFVAGSDGWRLYRRSQVALPSCVSSTRRAGFLRVCLAARVPRSESSRGDFASLGRPSPETASRYAGAELCRMRDRVFSASAAWCSRISAHVSRGCPSCFSRTVRGGEGSSHTAGAQADPAGLEGRGGSCDVRLGVR